MAQDKKFCIDVGHGGYDVGAVNGLLIERDMNLVVALEVDRLLKFYQCEVMLTRYNVGTFKSPTDKAKMANAFNADFLLSIHHNAGGGDGYDIIHSVFTNESFGDEFAKVLAVEFEKLGQNRHNVFSRWNSSYNDDFYGIIRNADMDTVISEFAFIDSKDREAVDTECELKQEGQAIVNAMVSYFKLKKRGVVMKTYKEIINETTTNPSEWIKAVDTMTSIAELPSNLGELNIFRFLPLLIEKIGNSTES